MPTDPFWLNPVLSSMMRDSNLLAGFININTISSGNREVEQEIVANVAGYGRQLGRILDVMKILLDKNVLGALNEREQEAADELKKLIDDVEKTKYEMHPTGVTPQNVDQVIKGLKKLEPRDRDAVLAEIYKTFPLEREG